MRQFSVFTIACVLSTSILTAQTAKRLNKAIDLLEDGQPIYYAGAGAGDYEAGKKTAQTTADYINYNLEHGAFDIPKLREFMRGLVDGGPTKSGHRTPAVIVTPPMYGLSGEQMRANNWLIHQLLAAGVHGILLTHPNDLEAVRVFVQSSRYPHAPIGPGLPRDTGLERGSGSQSYASEIWGLSGEEYQKRADVWPLNPEGELMLGLKIENHHAVAISEQIAAVPGIAFAEWGPGDNSLFLFGPGGNPLGSNHPRLQKIRSRVLAATNAAGIAFLNSCNENNVIDMIKEGVMICTGGEGPGAAKGREFTKRPQPW